MAKERGELIREKRKLLGMSMEDLAKQIGASRSFVCLLERGKTGISALKAERLSQALGIPFAELFTADGGVANEGPRWLRYLTGKYGLTEEDRRLIEKFVTQSGIADACDEETEESFRRKWDGFYKTIQSFLPNANKRFFEDDDVKCALRLMGIPEAKTLNEIMSRVGEIINRRLGNGSCIQDGWTWRRRVEEALAIESVDMGRDDDLTALMASRPQLSDPSIVGGIAMVVNSENVYGAIYRLKDSVKYIYVHDNAESKQARRDYPFWHEAARALIDPDLSLGRGVVSHPDGEERAPIELLLCRVAAIMAFSFEGAREMLASHSQAPNELSVRAVDEIRNRIYPQSTFRMIVIALMETIGRPVVYVDAYLRLKNQQRMERGIRANEVEKMKADPAARLRVGFVFKNTLAEDAGIELRYGMRIGKSSPISLSFDAKDRRVAAEELAKWDYGLSGIPTTCADYTPKDEHVRALMLF